MEIHENRPHSSWENILVRRTSRDIRGCTVVNYLCIDAAPRAGSAGYRASGVARLLELGGTGAQRPLVGNNNMKDSETEATRSTKHSCSRWSQGLVEWSLVRSRDNFLVRPQEAKSPGALGIDKVVTIRMQHLTICKWH